MKNNRTGVVIIMAHLVITLAILGGYVYTLVTGNPDEALKMALLTIIGYWFGAIGKDAITGINKKQEVKEGEKND